MNFKIFDDEFEENKNNYLTEINVLQKKVICSEKISAWDNYVKKVLVDTRSYYIILYCLNVMDNLNKKNNFNSEIEYYNNCLISAMKFMPDKTFLETAIMIISKFHDKGPALAEKQGVNVEQLIQEAKSIVKK